VIRKRGTGLQVQVYAGRDPLTGRKRYVSQQVAGQTKASMRQAKQIEARLLEEVGAGRHKGSRSRTMAELLERWLVWRPTVRPIAPTTVSSYRAAMDRYILPALGKLPVRQLDAATLDAFYAQLRTRGGKNGRPLAATASTVHEVHAVLSGALKQAVVWGWVGHNPAKLATAPSVERPDVQPPQAEDAARLLSAAHAEGPELGLFLRLAVVLGARRGEICGLRWPDIDLERGEVLIAGSDSRQAPRGRGRRHGRAAARPPDRSGQGRPRLRDHPGRRCLCVLPCPRRVGADRPRRHLPPLPPTRPPPRRARPAARPAPLHGHPPGRRGVDWRTVSGRAGHADGHMTLAS
jgi:integrase